MSSELSSNTASSSRSSTPATVKSAKGRDLGLAKLIQTQAAKTTGKASKKTPVDKFQETRSAETARLREKTRMLHEEKMARLANKKLKYEMANREAAAHRTSQLELLRLQIQLETVKAQAVAPALPSHSHGVSWDLPIAGGLNARHGSQSASDQLTPSWPHLRGPGIAEGDGGVKGIPMRAPFSLHGLDEDSPGASNYHFQGSNNPGMLSFDNVNLF